MRNRSSQKVTLEQVMEVPGLATQLMAVLPIPDRVRLRRTSKAFLVAVDTSLLGVTELFGEDLQRGGREPGTGALSWLLRKCPNLQVLSMELREPIADPFYGVEEWESLSLMEMETKGTKLGAALEDIAAMCKGLKHLSVARCSGVTDGGVLAIAGACQGLESLNVAATQIGDAAIQAVAASCPGLQRLVVTNCKRVSDASLVSVAKHCRQLVALSVDETLVTDAGVTAVAQNCPRLRQLAVGANASDAAIAQVAAHCPALETLGVANCKRVTDASIKRIAECCPRLTRLDAGGAGIRDEGISALATTCPRLRHLDLGLGRCTVPLILRSLAGADAPDTRGGGIAVLAGCKQLEYLDVSDWQRVTDEGIAEVARGCTRLRHLAVTECKLLTDVGISRVAASCSGLQELIVSHTKITAAGLKAVASGCPELRYVDLAMSHAGGEGLIALANGCRKLEHLDVSGVYDFVKRPAIEAIARCCPRLRVFRADCDDLSDADVAPLVETKDSALRVLDLSACDDISDKTVRLVAKNCPRLQALRVSGCRRVKDASVTQLAKHCKDLQYVDVDESGVTFFSQDLQKNMRGILWHGSTGCMQALRFMLFANRSPFLFISF
eukprot:jgi/Mesvir1/29112/Mv18418-RA.1